MTSEVVICNNIKCPHHRLGEIDGICIKELVKINADGKCEHC
jgi:hypothetical protein